LDAVLAHAKKRDVPIMSAGGWLDFWEGRYAANFTDLSLDAGFNGRTRMSFRLDAPLAVKRLTAMMPSSYLNLSISGIAIDENAHLYSQAELDGSSYALFVVGLGIHEIVVTYEGSS
jgi:hypothetical protein